MPKPRLLQSTTVHAQKTEHIPATPCRLQSPMCVLFAALSMTATKTYKDTFDNMLLKCLALSSLSYQKRHIRLPCPSACLLNIDDVVSLSLRLSEMGDSAEDAMDDSVFTRSTRSRLYTIQGEKYTPSQTDSLTVQKILLKGYLQNTQQISAKGGCIAIS